MADMAKHQAMACSQTYFKGVLAWMANTIFFAETYSNSVEMSSSILNFFQLHEQNHTWGVALGSCPSGVQSSPCKDKTGFGEKSFLPCFPLERAQPGCVGSVGKCVAKQPTIAKAFTLTSAIYCT